MLRKNKGSILVMTMTAFLLISIITVTCCSLVLSQSKYINYNYKDVSMKEECLSIIELIYSNTLNQVKLTLEEVDTKEEFEKYFNSQEFINKIENVSLSNLEGASCEVKLSDNYKGENCIYYWIKAISSHGKFKKIVVANLKIENPFETQAIQEDNLEGINQEDGMENTDDTILENEELLNNEADIKISDLVTIFEYKE